MEKNKYILVLSIAMVISLAISISSVIYITNIIQGGITSGVYKKIIIEKTVDTVEFFDNLKKEVRKNLLYRREREKFQSKLGKLGGNSNDIYSSNTFLPNTTISYRYY